jgi:type I restriction enzyme, S subunit
MSRWPMVPLGEIATLITRPMTVEPTNRYRTLGVRWWGEGAYERQTIDGCDTVARRLSLVQKDDLIINKIWVRHGSIAIASDAVDGCAASNEFPTFVIDRAKAEPRWLHWLAKTQWFWAQCDALSSGTSGKNRIKPERFLGIRVPVAPLAQQRRIVARIDALAAKTNEARGLRSQVRSETNHLMKAVLENLFDRGSRAENWPQVPLREAATIARGKFAHRPRNEPRFYGGSVPFIQIGDISAARRYIRTFSQTLNEEGLGISRMFPRGTIAIAITGATVGATGILGFDTCFPDSIVGIQPLPGITSSEFIYWAVEREKHKALAQATQTTQPNINLKKLDSLTIPLPSAAAQTKLVGQLAAIDGMAMQLETHQACADEHLELMLPAILNCAFQDEVFARAAVP